MTKKHREDALKCSVSPCKDGIFIKIFYTSNYSINLAPFDLADIYIICFVLTLKSIIILFALKSFYLY